MNKIFICALLLGMFFLGNALIIIAQSDTINELHPGDLEIYGKILSRNDSINSTLIPGANIYHIISYRKLHGENLESKWDSLRHVYYVTEDGEFYIVLEHETTNVLVFTYPGHYTKMIYVSLEGSSHTEIDETMLMDMDVVLGEAKFRRVRKILENEFAGIGRYNTELDDVSWDDQYQRRLKEKISRRHWWWPWKIKES